MLTGMLVFIADGETAQVVAAAFISMAAMVRGGARKRRVHHKLETGLDNADPCSVPARWCMLSTPRSIKIR